MLQKKEEVARSPPLVGANTIGTEACALTFWPKLMLLMAAVLGLLGQSSHDSVNLGLWRQRQRWRLKWDIPSAACPESWDGVVGKWVIWAILGPSRAGPKLCLATRLLNGDQVLGKSTQKKLISGQTVDFYFTWSHLCLYWQTQMNPSPRIFMLLYLPGTRGWCGKPVLHHTTCFTLLWRHLMFCVFVFTSCLPRLNFS